MGNGSAGGDQSSSSLLFSRLDFMLAKAWTAYAMPNNNIIIIVRDKGRVLRLPRDNNSQKSKLVGVGKTKKEAKRAERVKQDGNKKKRWKLTDEGELQYWEGTGRSRRSRAIYWLALFASSGILAFHAQARSCVGQKHKFKNKTKKNNNMHQLMLGTKINK